MKWLAFDSNYVCLCLCVCVCVTHNHRTVNCHVLQFCWLSLSLCVCVYNLLVNVDTRRGKSVMCMCHELRTKKAWKLHRLRLLSFFSCSDKCTLVFEWYAKQKAGTSSKKHAGEWEREEDAGKRASLMGIYWRVTSLVIVERKKERKWCTHWTCKTLSIVLVYVSVLFVEYFDSTTNVHSVCQLNSECM